MAIKNLRTDLRIAILVLVLYKINCDELRPQQITKPNFMPNLPGEHLLRGSSEERHVDFDIVNIKENVKKSNNSEDIPKIEAEIIKNTETIKHDDKQTNSKPEEATTEFISEYDVYDQKDYSATMNVDTQTVNETFETPTDKPAEEQVTTEEDIETLAITERAETDDVYKHKNILSTDAVNDNDINNKSIIELEAVSDSTNALMNDASTTVSTNTIENLETVPKMAFFNDLSEMQRNPKTDNGDTTLPSSKRDFQKPRPQIKISKSSTLKDWLEDSWLRPPVALLVPLRPLTITRALAVWNDLTSSQEGLNITDIIIIGYDSKGINWRSRHNLQKIGGFSSNTGIVSEALSKLLLKYQNVLPRDAKGEGTMRALASAAKVVPYDSALFVLTDKAPSDYPKLQLAVKALIEKRLKVYTIWTDPQYPSAESETALAYLKSVSQHTEGDVLPYSLQMDMSHAANLAMELEWKSGDLPPPRIARLKSIPGDRLETLLVRRGGGGATSLGIPVDSEVKTLRIFIEGAVERAVLFPPNEGPQIDLYNETSVKEFSPDSMTNMLTPRDVFLVFPGPDRNVDRYSVLPVIMPENTGMPTVGLWHLSVKCDTCDYRLSITAQARIGLDAMPVGEGTNREMLHLRIRGPVTSVRETSLVDEYGTELAKLPFTYHPSTADIMAHKMDSRLGNEPDLPGLVADVPLPRVKGPRIYAKIVGRDLHGESFVRLAGPIYHRSETRMGRSASIVFPDDSINDLEYFEDRNMRQIAYNPNYNDTDTIPYNTAVSQVMSQRGTILTAVQIGLSTRLYGTPGDFLQLHFEVTNYRDSSVRFRFEAVGQQRFLRSINPTSQVVYSGQTVNVIVDVGITNSAQPGVRDLITFTAYGLEQVSISTYVYVLSSNSVVADTWAPSLRHTFQGHCMGKQGSDCAQHIWSTTVFARDPIGGLLRLSSSPVGLMYENNFVSGTRDEVMATYRATCCAPRVLINGIDAYGNANSYTIDISNYFTGAAIAAITLGVLFGIALVALIIFLGCICYRRRKASRELPSYATSSRREVS